MSDHGIIIKQNYIKILGKTVVFMAAYCHRNIMSSELTMHDTIVKGVDTLLLYS